MGKCYRNVPIYFNTTFGLYKYLFDDKIIKITNLSNSQYLNVFIHKMVVLNHRFT